MTVTAAHAPRSANPPGSVWDEIRTDRAGLVAVLVLTGGLAAMSLLRWSNHWAGALDLGLFDQGVWLLSEGRAPELTILDENLFGDHFSPVLLLFVPLYALHPSPAWLLVVQAVVVATTVLPLRALARDLSVEPGWATLAVVASSPILMMNLYDFHPVSLTPPLVAAGLLAAHRDQARAALLITVAVGLVRADSAILMLGVAVVAGPRARRVIVPTAVAFMVLGAAVPVLLHSEQTFERYYHRLGTGPLDALTHPWRIVAALFGEQSLRTLLLWLVPTGFLPLLRPRWFLALVVGGLPILLSSKVNTSLAWFHHAGTVAPLAIGGALAGLAWARQRLGAVPGADEERGGRRHVAVLALHSVLPLGLALALITQGPFTPDGPRSQTIDAFRARPTPGLDAALSAVDPDDRVAAESWIVVELARRPVIHVVSCERDPDGCDIPGPPGDQIDVVLAHIDHTDALTALGWQVDPATGGAIVVARAPEGR